MGPHYQLYSLLPFHFVLLSYKQRLSSALPSWPVFFPLDKPEHYVNSCILPREFIDPAPGSDSSMFSVRFVKLFIYFATFPARVSFSVQNIRGNTRAHARVHLACPTEDTKHFLLTPIFLPFPFLSGTLSESHVSIMKVKGQVVH